MYTNERSDGRILATYPEEWMAVADAKQRLEDDPELGEVYVFQVTEIGRATHVPDSDWQSVVGWLRPGEKIMPPGPIPAFICSPEDVDESAGAYELSDPKHPEFHSIHADLYDNRPGK